MEPTKAAFSNIDEYIAQYPPEVQEVLQTLRSVIKEAAPGAKEKISYGMPAFELNGILVYFAAYKKHIGFYPTASGISHFKDRLSAYTVSKGTVQLPIDKPLPYDLITEMVEFRAEENRMKAESKMKKKP
ncbi:iron chaperone [Gorillibacterium massiliense]|uniref:iron chaperone n=1 Tax=Gorillibacterium massiliense TaxID=1280390 RepID=UPI0004B69A4A|nr:DUF1801 domain-containing protein [Gorillibacterium massiliense]